MTTKTKKNDFEITTQNDLITDLSTENDGYQKYLDRIHPDKRKRIWNSVSKMRNSLHTVAPVVCMGPEKCIWYAKCPIPEIDARGEKKVGPLSDYPIGEACVMESYFMRQKIIDYVLHMNVDGNDPVEMSIVNELALIDLLKNRCLMILSVGDKDGQGVDMIRKDIAGFGMDQEGGSREDMPTTKSALHPAAQYLDSLEKRREKWLDKLVQTRKGKQEMALKAGTVTRDSKLLQNIALVAEQLAELQRKPLVLDVDKDAIEFDD